MRELVSILAPWRAVLGLVAMCVLAGALLELVPPLVLRRVIDEHLTTGQADGLLGLGMLYLGATALALGVGFGGAYLAALSAQGALHELRVRLFSHVQRLPIAYFDRTPLGDVIGRCTADVETVDTLFSSGVSQLVANLVRLIFVAAAMVALSPPLAIVSALVLPPLVVVTRYFQVRVRAAERSNRRAVGDLNTHLQETLAGVEIIRPFARESVFVARFRVVLAATVAAYNRTTFYAALYPPVTAALSAFAIAILIWMGTGGALAGWGVSLGTLTAFLVLFQQFFTPITALGDEWQTVQSALSGAERIFEVLGTPADDLPSGATAIDAGSADPIVMRDVMFGYAANRPILRGVSLVVRSGEHVALVGRTGAGKTSLLHVLGGLYAPLSGTVLVAGRDPRALAPDERRRVVSVVPQQVQLFGGTVRDNVSFDDASVSPEAVRRALSLVGAAEIIDALPGGIDTPLSSGRGVGAQLSAGQRQLLALARALVWEPRVLLLDEATAAIDAASDASFRAALRSAVLARGCGVLTVAHRLSTAREADRVVVLEHGRVVEDGPPEDLIRRGGRFAALVELEAAGWDWRADAPMTKAISGNR